MHLFSPISFKTVTLRNRIVVSPMCQYSSEDGFANDWHFVHLGSRAIGGAGLIFTEAAAVEATGRITPNDLGIYHDSHIHELKRITAFLELHGAVPGIQLAHAGRKASTSRPWDGGAPLAAALGGWSPVAGPGELPFGEGYQAPHALSPGEISGIVHTFGAAARRACDAGFKVVEVHGAHGYLLHEFLSPASNQRTDEYGGSLENRARFLLEVVDSVRQSWPMELPVFVRLSCTDWVTGGLTIDDTVSVAGLLKEQGVDLIDCSSGGNVQKAEIPTGPGYQTQFAEQIRREVEIATGAVGMITEPVQADHIIRTGQADLVFLAREMLRDPYFAHRAAKELRQPGLLPVQYGRA